MKKKKKKEEEEELKERRWTTKGGKGSKRSGKSDEKKNERIRAKIVSLGKIFRIPSNLIYKYTKNIIKLLLFVMTLLNPCKNKKIFYS